jgi:hypothetical protein
MRERSLKLYQYYIPLWYVCKLGSLVIGLDLALVGYEFVVALDGEVQGAEEDAEGDDEEDDPRCGDEVEARV